MGTQRNEGMPEDQDACRQVVYHFCTEMNDWERLRYILGRIEDGKYVSQKDRDAVTGITKEGHLAAHARLFAQYVVSRERKYGSNPGSPNCWGDKGRYYNVSFDTIKSVEFRNKNCAEVITDWGYLAPAGQLKFVLKRQGGRWLVDSLSSRCLGAWRTGFL